MKQTLEDKQDEKGRLWKAYRAKKREAWRDLCQREPRMIGFRRALRRTRDTGAFVVRLSDSWLRNADADVRFAALQQIDTHAGRMALRLGGRDLDDPMPPSINLFLVSRELLGVR